MLAYVALLMAVALPQGRDIILREPIGPSQVTTSLDVECVGRPIRVRWIERYPGYHEIAEITVDGVPLAEDQFRTLMSLIVELEIESISVTRCYDRGGTFVVEMVVQFGEASARRTNSRRHVGLRVAQGRITVLR